MCDNKMACGVERNDAQISRRYATGQVEEEDDETRLAQTEAKDYGAYSSGRESARARSVRQSGN